MTKVIALYVATCVFWLTATAGAAQSHGDSAVPPDLHGTWTLNKSLSDKTPSLPTDDGRSDGRGGDGGSGGRGMPPARGAMPGGFGGASMPDPEQMKKMGAVVDELMQAIERFTIVQPEPTVITMIDVDGHTRTFSVSGEKERHQLQSSTVDVQSRWDGPVLRQEISIGTVRVIRTFIRDVQQNRLTVTVAPAESQRGMPLLKRVYDVDER